MPFIGNQPALSYTSFAKQDFTTSATTSYTLDHPVTNENEIALFINFVRQEPTTAYTASNTSLTLTSATSATDDMYCVFLGKAVQTVNPPSGSVGLSQLSATGTKDATTFLRGDNTFASAGVNTPSFFAFNDNTQAGSENTTTKLAFRTEVWDVGGVYDNSLYRFTPAFVGKSNISCGFWSYDAQSNIYRLDVKLYKNGAMLTSFENRFTSGNTTATRKWINFNMNVSHDADDYYEVYAIFRTTDGGGADIISSSGNTSEYFNYFTAFKIIE